MADINPNPESNPPATARDAAQVLQDPEFQELVRRKSSLSTTLSLVLLIAYFGYVGLLAFAPGVLSQTIGAVTMGIPVGIGLIVLAWILTGVYVRWANSSYDSMIKRVKGKIS